MNNELNAYLEAIKADFRKWSTCKDGSVAQSILDNSIVRFEAGLKIVETQLYYKVISGSGVHSFIVKVDGPKFKAGDILKAATWKAPAKNQARGNIFGEYRIRWTGAEYLR